MAYDPRMEKIILFDLLESFFEIYGSDGASSDIRRVFDAAKKSGSHETYLQLLGKLSQSPLKPGFIVESVPFGNSSTYKVKFLSETNFDGAQGINGMASKNQDMLLTDVKMNVSSEVEKTVSTISRTIQHHDRKIQHHDRRIEKYDNKMKNHDREIEHLREDLYRLRDLAISEQKRNLDRETDYMDCVSDAFSFIMIRPLSIQALAAWFIFLLQMSSFFLSVEADLFNPPPDNGFLKKPPLNLPVGVGPFVHSGQGISLFLIVLVQEALWEAVANLCNGYNHHLREQGIDYIWWLIPNILRGFASLVALFVTFILVLVSDNTVDLFKDFTAMLFVSSFDNILFVIAKMNIIGRRFKHAADQVEGVTHRFTHTLRTDKKKSNTPRVLLKWLLKPYILAAVLYFAIYFGWMNLILLPHLNGAYLCQEMFIQLDNRVNPDLSFYSGRYKLLRGEDKRGIYPAYIESKRFFQESESKKPMIVRYCHNLRSWVFVVETEKRDDECDKDHILVKSSDAENQEQYNIFDMSKDEWEVKYEDGRFMQLDDLFMACFDQEPEKDSFDYFKLCQEIETDTMFDPFESSRSWSQKFSALRHDKDKSKLVTTYEHIIYISSNKQDIIFFTGKQWVLTSVKDLFDLTPENELGSYLEKDFHGKWSKFKVTFISEPVMTDTPENTMTPTLLTWYLATRQKKINETQVIDTNREVGTSLLCGTCTDTDGANPCYFDGVCLDDKTCQCTKGSSGKLCQEPPTSNGLCDIYFNKHEFNYDGGDCCIDTCKSTDDYLCGRDRTRRFYVGYDLCSSNNNCVDCWSTTELPSSITSLTITHVSISESGRFLALIDSNSKSVRVYDNTGSIWRLRGSPVATSKDPTTDSVEVSGYINGINNDNILTPVTVAFRTDNEVRIYDWANDSNQWEETWNSTSLNLTEEFKKIQLCDSGKSLGIMSTRSFILLHRSDYSMPWNEVKKMNTKYLSFSLTTNGNNMVLSTSNTVEMHNKSAVILTESFKREVKTVKMSPGGQILAVLLEYQGQSGEIKFYNLTSNTFISMENTLRGISSVGAEIQVTDDGLTIETFSTDTNELKFYEWRHSMWQTYKKLVGGSPSFSSNKLTLAMSSFIPTISSGSGGSLKIHNRKPNDCDEGTVPAYFTFAADNAPDELTWEIFVSTSTGVFVSLKKGGPFEYAESMTVDKFCINNSILSSTKDESDRILGVKITDKGLDGLQNPGIAGLSVNGTVIWSVKETNGYVNTFSVNGSSLNNKSPWSRRYDPLTNIDCQSTDCEWEKIGSVAYEYKRQNKERFMEMSADGLTFALGNHDNAEVRIFKYNSTGGWIQQGSNITANDANETNGEFGRTVSLSADGSIIAVGAPLYALDGVEDTGQVRVYQYNNTGDEWSQLGGSINTEIEDSHLGWHVSLSADGKTLAVSFKLNADCSAFVYKYDDNTNEWNQQGDCLVTNENKGRSNVQLSGTGSVVAVASYDEPAHIKVFKYNRGENRWSQQGLNISQGTEFFGSQLSLSSDGLTLAGAGNARDGLQVYNFNRETNDWEKKGQVITTDRGYFFDIALSSSGSFLVLAYENIFESYIYEKVSKLWIKSLVPRPEINYSSNYPRISISADALVVAVREDDAVSVFRLIRQSSSSSLCRKDENFFNFTIKPDQFPQDIDWFLEGANGVSLLGGRLPVTLDESSYLIYERCVSKHHKIFTFFIEDDYKDGICCQWGNGTFQLEWNSEIVLDNRDFSSEKILCLPTSSNASVYSIEIVPKQTSISWNLFDSDFNTTLMEGIFQPSTPEDKYVYKRCLPSNDCMILVMYNPAGDSVSFKLRENNQIIHQHNESFNITKVPLGSCTRQCSDGYSLFDFDIGTDEVPTDLYWRLVDSNYTILASRDAGHYKQRKKYENFYMCVPSNNCLTLTIHDAIIDSNATNGTHYNVTLDGKTIIADTGFKNRTILNKMGNCNIPTCSWNRASLELDIFTMNQPETFSWQLLNSSSGIIDSGGEDYVPLKNYFQHYCLDVAVGSCVTLRFRDTKSHTQQEIITIVWNDEIIKNGYSFLNKIEENIVLCNKKCPEESTFTFFTFKTDVNPSEFSWNVVDLNGTTKYSGGNYTEPFADYDERFCVPDVDNECLTFQAFDSAKNGGTLTQLEQGNYKGNNSDIFHYGIANKQVTKVPFPSSKCSCPQGESLFELDLHFGRFKPDLVINPIQHTWDLVTVDGSIITSGSQYTKLNYNYKHRECLPDLGANDCLAINFFIHYYYSNIAVDKTVRLNDTQKHKKRRSYRERDTVVINGNCGSRSFRICSEGYRSVKIVMFTVNCTGDPSCPLGNIPFGERQIEKRPKQFLWEVVDYQNKTVMNGRKDADEYDHEFYHYRKCVPSDACLSFRFLESSYNGGVIVDYFKDYKYNHNKKPPLSSDKQINKTSYNDDEYQIALDDCSKS